jgi:hypothetical protein
MSNIVSWFVNGGTICELKALIAGIAHIDALQVRQIVFGLDEMNKLHIAGFYLLCNRYKDSCHFNLLTNGEHLLSLYLRSLPKTCNIIKIFCWFKIYTDACLTWFPVTHYNDFCDQGVQIIQYLINAGLKIDAGSTLHEWLKFSRLNTAFIKLAITQKSINKYVNGDTPLIVALKHRSELAVTKLLVKSGANVNLASQGLSNWTPLDYSLNLNNNVKKYLLKAGADYNKMQTDRYCQMKIMTLFIEMQKAQIAKMETRHALEIEAMHDRMLPGKNFIKAFEEHYHKKPDANFIYEYAQYVHEHLHEFND